MKIGIDIGGSHIACGIVDKNGKIIEKESKDIDVRKTQDKDHIENLIIEIIESEVNELLEKNNYTMGDITKIGVAVPGSTKDGKIKRLVNLHIEDFDIQNIIKEKYNTDVDVRNDGKCAGIAEKKYGALKRYSDCVFLCIGTGVGSAVFLDDELLEPKRNSGFELGHMVIEKEGKECNCGRKGCFETYASMKRFKLLAIEAFKLARTTESEVLQSYIRANFGKKYVQNFINEYLNNISIGLENIINIFEPETICFGGSFSYYADIFLPMLEEKIYNDIERKVKLVRAELKNDAGIIGAVNY